MKQCVGCKENKPLDEFYKANYKSEQDGLDYYCKYCRSGMNLKSHRHKKKPCSLEECDRPHYALSYCRMHYARVMRTGKVEGKHSKHANMQRENQLKHFYKMTLDEFNKRSANGCELCGNKPERSLHVDHDHNCCDSAKSCGKCVRGVVCNKCNKVIDKYETGKIRPDYPYLDKVKQYLEAYSGK